MIILSPEILTALGGIEAIRSHPALTSEAICVYSNAPDADPAPAMADSAAPVFAFLFTPPPPSSLVALRHIILNLSLGRASPLPAGGMVFLARPIGLTALARRVLLTRRFPRQVFHRPPLAGDTFDDLVFGAEITHLPILKVFFLNMDEQTPPGATAISLDILRQNFPT